MYYYINLYSKIWDLLICRVCRACNQYLLKLEIHREHYDILRIVYHKLHKNSKYYNVNP